MKVPVVKTDFPIIKITVVQPDGVRQQAFVEAGSCENYYFTLPVQMQPEDCLVYSEFCDGNSRPIAEPVVHWGSREMLEQEAKESIDLEPEQVEEPEQIEEPEQVEESERIEDSI